MRLFAALTGLLAALAVFTGPLMVQPRPTPPRSPPPPAALTQPPRPPPAAAVLHDFRVATSARELLTRRARGFRDDCSGFVASVLAAVNALHVPSQATVAVFRADAESRDAVHHDPIPIVGDLVFFDNTWDRNGNGRMDDPDTHIAVVVDVEPDGTVVMAHKGSDRRLIRMNLLHPNAGASPDGRPWNSWLRRTGDRGNPLGLYRTGQLWSGFGRRPVVGGPTKAASDGIAMAPAN